MADSGRQSTSILVTSSILFCMAFAGHVSTQTATMLPIGLLLQATSLEMLSQKVKVKGA